LSNLETALARGFTANSTGERSLGYLNRYRLAGHLHDIAIGDRRGNNPGKDNENQLKQPRHGVN